MKKQTETFSFKSPINLSEEGKWLLAVTSIEAINSVFDITDENNSLSISSPNYQIPEDGEEFIIELKILFQLRSENDIDLHVKEVAKRRIRKEIENSGYKLAGFDHFKSEILAELKRVTCKDLEDMVCRMELTYKEIVNILDVNYNAGSIFGYTLPLGI